MLTRYLLALTLLIPAFAAEWDQTAFPDWSDRAVLRLLTGSAWSKPRTVQFTWRKREEGPFSYKNIPGADHGGQPNIGSPVGGIGARKSHLPDKANILLRWSNALPVRQAKALYQLREDKLPPTKLNELVGVPEPTYVLELFGLPAEIAYQGTGTVESLLMQSAKLRTKTGRSIKPSRVSVTTSGLQLRIFIHFTKQFALTLADKELEFTADLQLFQLKETFQLSDMVYQGALDL